MKSAPDSQDQDPLPAADEGSLGQRLRQRLGGTVFDYGLTGLGHLARLHPRARPGAHAVELRRDLAYQAPHKSDRRAHLLDIYRPLTDEEGRPVAGSPAVYGAPHPVVLYLHGGAFRILSKDTHRSLALPFARHGCLVFNCNYRLAPQHPFPAALEDAAAALEYVVREAPRLGGDLSRLVLAGESAGGNLVTALSLLTCVERPERFARRAYELNVVPRVVLPLCGMLQVSDAERFARKKRLPNWVHDRLLETRDAYLSGVPDGAHELADPLLLLETGLKGLARQLPAYFASVGTRDPLLDDTRRLGQALERLGAAHKIGYYDGELHAFQALVFRKNAIRFWQDTYAFLDEHLKG